MCKIIYQIKAEHVLLNNGEKIMVKHRNEMFELFCEEIGELDLPTGEIVACDPFMDKEKPFPKKVKGGKYPILLNNIKYSENHQRTFFAIIKFNNNKVVKWEMALLERDNIDILKEGQFFGYPVDTGTGAFIDKKYVDMLIEYETKDPDKLNEELEEKIEILYEDNVNVNGIILTINDNIHMATFSSGWGDGHYPSFWGLDENGEIVCLVTDFVIIDSED